MGTLLRSKETYCEVVSIFELKKSVKCDIYNMKNNFRYKMVAESAESEPVFSRLPLIDNYKFSRDCVFVFGFRIGKKLEILQFPVQSVI